VDDTPASGGALGTARLYCESCSEETVHCILRVDRGAVGPWPKAVRGIARCRTCRWTHPFESSRAETVALEVVVSKGAANERRLVRGGPYETLRVDERVPGLDPSGTVRRIDLKDGTRASTREPRERFPTWYERPARAPFPVDDSGGRTRGAGVEGLGFPEQDLSPWTPSRSGSG